MKTCAHIYNIPLYTMFRRRQCRRGLQGPSLLPKEGERATLRTLLRTLHKKKLKIVYVPDSQGAARPPPGLGRRKEEEEEIRAPTCKVRPGRSPASAGKRRKASAGKRRKKRKKRSEPRHARCGRPRQVEEEEEAETRNSRGAARLARNPPDDYFKLRKGTCLD